MTELRTDRLVMRRWRDEDREPFAAMGADPEVMRYFPGLMTRAESDALIDNVEAAFDERGWGLWALEADGAFIGFTGLWIPSFEEHFTPAVEVGWRLARHAWGHGYATEAAREAVRYGFEILDLEEIVSFTAVENWPSRRVMERIGMTHDAAGDFDHRALPEGHPLRRHVLYRLRKS